jgi:16S rRNA (cytosine967-C5)-methyltransferase
VQEELSAAGIETRFAEHPDTLVAGAEETGAIASSAAFVEGRLTIQGQAALKAADLMQAQTGEKLLDLCASPGGKTVRLLEAGAHVTANDVEPERMQRVAESAERLHLMEHLTLTGGDSIEAIDETDFDGVLVDAPCSNTGVLGARPAARWRFGPQTLRSLVELQGRLLRDAAQKVRTGGRLVWSTCSLEPEENEQLLSRFMEETPGWSIEEEHTTLPDLRSECGPYDGGFAARLRKA